MSVILSFGTLLQVPGNENPSVLISFATKSINAGQITSKLHVIELGAQPGSYFLALSLCFSLLLFLYSYGGHFFCPHFFSFM